MARADACANIGPLSRHLSYSSLAVPKNKEDRKQAVSRCMYSYVRIPFPAREFYHAKHAVKGESESPEFDEEIPFAFMTPLPT